MFLQTLRLLTSRWLICSLTCQQAIAFCRSQTKFTETCNLCMSTRYNLTKVRVLRGIMKLGASLLCKCRLHISWGHSPCANTVGFGTFPGFCELLVQCAKMRPVGGGGVYFLKSVRKGRFRNVWVGGGG